MLYADDLVIMAPTIEQSNLADGWLIGGLACFAKD